jgi:YbbR domain-containing protein
MNWLITKIKEDWKAKIVSILIALVFWVYVQELQYDTVNLSVPIDYIQQPENIFWKSEPPRFIKLVVRGKKEDIKFPTSNLKAIVDLSEARPGKHNYSVLFDKKQIPEKVSISSSTDKVIIDFDRGIQKILWIKAEIQGEVAEGFKLGRITVTPNRVQVKGPAQILNQIRSISTKPVIINDLKESATFHVPLTSENQFEIMNGSEVEVELTVYKQDTTNEKFIENIKIDILGKDPALNASLSTNTVKVYIKGNADDLKKIDPSQFHAFINLDGTRFIQKTLNILPFDYEPDIIINIKNLVSDKKIEILELIPSTVSVRFSVKPDYYKKAEESLQKDNNKEGIIQPIEDSPVETTNTTTGGGTK